MPTPPTSPQRYDPSIDPLEEDEDKIAEQITETMLKIADKTWADNRHASRSVHAKSHGLIKAELEVLPDLPPVLAQGLFAEAGRYPVIMRFSTIPGDILPDKVSTPRGVAMKVVGVSGERLEGSEDAVTQDFILVNGPTFNASSAKAFLGNLKLLAATTDKAEGAKEAVSVVFRQIEKAVEAFGGQSATLSALGGQQPRHILGETFFNQLPIRYGDYVAKLSLAPASPELLALEEATIDLDADPDAIRQAMITHFAFYGGQWLLRVQLCANLDDMPIEDPTKTWSEEISPFIPVARITALPQLAWSPARSDAVDDGMGFNVWKGLQAHRPLGSMMRMRKLAYARSQQFRSERNATPVRDPVSLDDLPD